MKRQISILACLLMLVAIVFAVASCNKPEEPHVHEYVKSVTKEATCLTKGELTYSCTGCDYKYTDEFAAKGHSLMILDAVAPTCTENGKTAGEKCHDCGYEAKPQIDIPATGHTLGAPATCTTPQTCKYGCTDAEGNLIVFVPALGHRLVGNGDYQAPTCTKDGQSESYTCSVCQGVKASEVIPATGHDVKDGVCVNCGVGSFTITLEDMDDEAECYYFTAPKAGYYTFFLPGGLGFHSADKKEAIDAAEAAGQDYWFIGEDGEWHSLEELYGAEVDFNNNRLGAHFSVYLNNKQEYGFYLTCAEYGEYEILWLYDRNEALTPDSLDLELGENSLTFGEAELVAGMVGGITPTHREAVYTFAGEGLYISVYYGNKLVASGYEHLEVLLPRDSMDLDARRPGPGGFGGGYLYTVIVEAAKEGDYTLDVSFDAPVYFDLGSTDCTVGADGLVAYLEVIDKGHYTLSCEGLTFVIKDAEGNVVENGSILIPGKYSVEVTGEAGDYTVDFAFEYALGSLYNMHELTQLPADLTPELYFDGDSYYYTFTAPANGHLTLIYTVNQPIYVNIGEAYDFEGTGTITIPVLKGLSYTIAFGSSDAVKAEAKINFKADALTEDDWKSFLDGSYVYLADGELYFEYGRIVYSGGYNEETWGYDNVAYYNYTVKLNLDGTLTLKLTLDEDSVVGTAPVLPDYLAEVYVVEEDWDGFIYVYIEKTISCLHIWDDGVVELDPTCTEVGSMLHTCIVCYDVKSVEIQANGHNYEDPKCDEPGTCTVCGDDNGGEAIGHSMVNATCTKDAYCNRPGCDYVVEGSMLPHSVKEDSEYTVTVIPTESMPGSIATKCEGCGLPLTMALPPINPMYMRVYQVQHGDCTNPVAVYTIPLTDFDMIIDGTIVVTFNVATQYDHVLGEAVVENNIDPTCTAKGSYNSVKYCTVFDCKHKEVTPVTVDSLGHLPGEEATCTTAQVCTRVGCGAELVAKLGHADADVDAKCDNCQKYFIPTAPFKLMLVQGNLNKVLYFAGEKSGNFFATTTASYYATDLYLEEVDGGYHIYFMKGDVKTYIKIYNWGSGIGVELDTNAPAEVFVFDEDNGTFTTTIDDVTYYMGTYQSYDTISKSEIAEISTGFPVRPVVLPAHDCEMSEATCGAPSTCEICGKMEGDALPHSDEDNDGECDDCGNFMSTLALLKALYAIGNNATFGKYTLTGVITNVNSAYDSSYNNVTVTIVVEGYTEYPIECYRMKGTGADIIGVGDTITVTGTLKDYNGKKEFDSGCTLDSYVLHESCTDFTEATCKAPASCVVCGTVKPGSTVVDHVYVDGECKWCGGTEGKETVTVTAKYSGSTTNMKDGNNASTIGLDSSVFTVTSIKNGQNNHVGLNKAGQIRLYAGLDSSKDGAELVVSVGAGYTIKSVKVTFGATNNGCTVTVDGTAVLTNCTDKNTTKTFEVNSDSFTMKNVAASGQVYITAIEITYE